jgi:hypothetical protein
MIAEPMSFRCQIRILEIEAEPGTERNLISFIIEEIPREAEGNSFFEKGRRAKGVSFDALPDIKSGTTVMADVKFFGDPFHLNYQISHVSLT